MRAIAEPALGKIEGQSPAEAALEPLNLHPRRSPSGTWVPIAVPSPESYTMSSSQRRRARRHDTRTRWCCVVNRRPERSSD